MTRDGDLPEFDNRPSVRFANTTPEHPKVVAMSDAAFRLWFDSICYCSRQELDGKITEPMMRKMGTPKTIRELLACRSLERTESGDYMVHDYLHHQRSAAEIQSFRESKSENGAKGAHMRWHVPTRKKVKDCPYCLQGVANV